MTATISRTATDTTAAAQTKTNAATGATTDVNATAGTAGTATASSAIVSADAQSTVTKEQVPTSHTPISTPTVTSEPQRQESLAQKAKPTAARRRAPLVSGASLTDILNATTAEIDDEQDTDIESDVAIDPLCESKLEHSKEDIIALIQRLRPRFVASFELMRIKGNEIAISVASEALREEILRNKTEILTRIVEVAGVSGVITLTVTVDEQIKAARPIKLEDRVKFLTDKNPMLSELRKALDMEIES